MMTAMTIETGQSTVAIHAIWSTYGSWPPGDPDKPGHWSPLFDMYGRLIRAGHQINLPDADTFHHARSLMKEDPKYLDEQEQRVVADVFESHLLDCRVHACAIERSHVHLLTGPIREHISRFIGRLKGTSSSALLKLPDNWNRKRIWTAGFWKVFLFNAEAMPVVRSYIEDHNLRRGMPAAPWDWIHP